METIYKNKYEYNQIGLDLKTEFSEMVEKFYQKCVDMNLNHIEIKEMMLSMVFIQTAFADAINSCEDDKV